jgi:hypothetical protein
MSNNPQAERGHKRKAEGQGDEDRPGRKHRQRQNDTPFTGSSRPKKHAIHRPKNQIRDLERMLAKATDMPATVRAGHERRLEALKHDLVITAAEKEKTRMIEKYHMVRFFDRKKAERHLKKAQRALKACEDPAARLNLEQNVYTAKIDLNYTMYYPLVRNYCALYPTKKDEDGKMHGDEETTVAGVRGDPEMWKVVETATKEGRLEALKWDLDLDTARQKTLAPKTKQQAKIPARKIAQDLSSRSNRRQRRQSKMEETALADSDLDSAEDLEGGAKLEPQIIDEEDGFFEK